MPAKKRHILIGLATAFLLSVAMPFHAQTKKHRVRLRLDSILTARYFNSPYDTNYVVRPEGKLTLKLRFNQTGNTIHSKGTVDDVYTKTDLHTNHKNTISIAAIYRGIGAAVAINPAKIAGLYKDYEFNMNYFSNRISIDASYQHSSTLTGTLKRNGEVQIEDGDANMNVINLAGYYIFNYSRFSFPAAFTQSYIQQRSAGSWLAGFSYQGGYIKTNDDVLKEKVPDAPQVRLYAGHFGIGGGYGYNLVLGKKWLLHASSLPTFVVYNRNNLTINGERKRAHHMRFNMIFNERMAIVHNFNSHYFASVTLVMNNSVFDDNVLIINQNKWRARASIGVRL